MTALVRRQWPARPALRPEMDCESGFCRQRPAMQSCGAFWPEMDWDSGLWCEWQAMRSCRAFWPEMDRQWPAMHSGVELLDEAPTAVAPKRCAMETSRACALVTCCDPRLCRAC